MPYLTETGPENVVTLKVVGVGGAGNNVVHRLGKSGTQGIEYAARQKQTLQMALDHQILVITGGPRTGKTTSLLGASSACLINALKALAGIDKKLPLIAPGVIQPIQHLKVEHLGNHNPRLHTDELLIALSICAVTNPMAAYAIDQLDKLRGCEAHSSVILSHVDEELFKKIGVNLSFEPKYQAKKLFHR